MIAVLDQTEIIVLSVLGLFYFVALLTFVLAIWRGKLQPIWRRVKIGVFIERNGHSDREEKDGRD